jgi:hypothetical protein
MQKDLIHNQDIAVKKKQKLETFKVLLIRSRRTWLDAFHLSKGHIEKQTS